jgi:hypothetical protein
MVVDTPAIAPRLHRTYQRQAEVLVVITEAAEPLRMAAEVVGLRTAEAEAVLMVVAVVAVVRTVEVAEDTAKQLYKPPRAQRGLTRIAWN